MSGLATTTNGAVVAAIPWFAFAAKPSGRGFAISCASTAGAGGFATTTSSSTWGVESGEAAVEVRIGPVCDDDAGDAHRSSR